MADNSKVIINSVKSHFEKLAAQYSRLQDECADLNNKLAQMQEILDAKDRKINDLTNELAQSEVRYKNLQISQKSELNARQLQENKERFAKLVREIDKCISLLNE